MFEFFHDKIPGQHVSTSQHLTPLQNFYKKEKNLCAVMLKLIFLLQVTRKQCCRTPSRILSYVNFYKLFPTRNFFHKMAFKP
jgi:hypothetical protein